jgi:hypothetical protein
MTTANTQFCPKVALSGSPDLGEGSCFEAALGDGTLQLGIKFLFVRGCSVHMVNGRSLYGNTHD